MQVRWFQGMSEKEKKEFTAALRGSTPVLERLKHMLEEDIIKADKDSKRLENYNKAAWSEHQADRIGTIRTLESVKTLITLDREKLND